MCASALVLGLDEISKEVIDKLIDDLLSRHSV